MKIQIITGDCREELRRFPDNHFQCCVTSPPYWGLRDYGVPPLVWGGDVICQHEWVRHHQPPKSGKNIAYEPGVRSNRAQQEMPNPMNDGVSSAFCLRCGAWRGQLGLEPSPELYVDHLAKVFREVRRVLRKDGTLWLNLSDTYAGSGPDRQQNVGNPGSKVSEGLDTRQPPIGLKPKDLVGIPWRMAFALRADGWWLRSDIIWEKPNCMPSSVRDRPTTSHEYMFLLAKGKSYYYDQDAIAIHPTGRKKRTVWTIPTRQSPTPHFATFPPDLVKPCILAGTSVKGQCPACGGAWERVVEPSEDYAKLLGKNYHDHSHDLSRGMSQEKVAPRVTADHRTLGWQPACDCNAGPVEYDRQVKDLPQTALFHRAGGPAPQLVLDPFAGAGTTGLVAAKLERDAVLIELNPKYTEMARNRLYGQLLPAKAGSL